ncbi:MAG: hypothetical protein AAFQ53_03135 [Bacteroidota bacterium]
MTNGLALVSTGPESGGYFVSFRYLLQLARKEGYAAGQVWYVAHSMGGLMLRSAVHDWASRYYSEPNYGLGYVDRAVTLNTPHNGSPWADLIGEVISAANESSGIFATPAVESTYAALANWYRLNPDALPFGLIRPDAPDGFRQVFTPVEAVQDLRRSGGVRFAETNVPTHLVGADLLPGDQPDFIVPDEAYRSIDIGQDAVELLNRLADIALAVAPELVREEIIEASGLSDAERALRFLEFSLRALEGVSFLADSDGIVGLPSQHAGLPRPSPGCESGATSLFENLRYFHVGIASRAPEIGDCVGRLLELPAGSPRFQPIPSGVTASARLEAGASALAAMFRIDPDVVIVDAPEVAIVASRQTADVGEVLDVEVSVADTTGLYAIRLYVQGNGQSSVVNAYRHQFSVELSPDLLGEQSIEAYAYFNYGDSLAVGAISRPLTVAATGALQAFSADHETFVLSPEREIQPTFTAVYDTYLAPLGLGSAGVSLTVEDPSIISYNPDANALVAQGAGGTRVFADYGGQRDTLYVSVEGVALPSSATLDLTVLLQGGSDGQTNSTSLNTGGHLPVVQPFGGSQFSGSPIAYNGTEEVPLDFFATHTTISDWVLVELRSTLTSEPSARRAAFVLADGSVVDLDGVSPVAFDAVVGGSYHVVVRHRNHLPIMSASAVDLSGGTASYDFTVALSQAYTHGGAAMVGLGVSGTAPFALWGGDGDGDGRVLAPDYQVVWLPSVGLEGYFMGDFDLDGRVLATDSQVLLIPNIGIAESQVPEAGASATEARYPPERQPPSGERSRHVELP